MQYIQLPDGTTAEFPDDISDEEIQAVLQSEYPSPERIPVAETPEAQALSGMVEPEEEGHWEGWIKPSLKEMGRAGIVAPAETAMALAGPVLTWPAGKLKGIATVINSLFSGGDPEKGAEMARAAEEDVMSLGYQPYTPEAQEAVELVGKAFHYGLWPARKAGEELTKMGYPRLAYLLETTGELAMFEVAHGVRAKVKARAAAKKAPVLKPEEFERFMTEERARQLEQEFAEIKPRPREELPAKLIEELRKAEPVEVAPYELAPEVKVEKPWQAVKPRERPEVLYKRRGRITKEKPEEILRAKLEEKKIAPKPTTKELASAKVVEKVGSSKPKDILAYYQKRYPALKNVKIGGLESTKESGKLVDEGVLRVKGNKAIIHLTKDASPITVRHEIEHLLDIIHKQPTVGKQEFARFTHAKFTEEYLAKKPPVKEVEKVVDRDVEGNILVYQGRVEGQPIKSTDFTFDKKRAEGFATAKTKEGKPRIDTYRAKDFPESSFIPAGKEHPVSIEEYAKLHQDLGYIKPEEIKAVAKPIPEAKVEKVRPEVKDLRRPGAKPTKLTILKDKKGLLAEIDTAIEKATGEGRIKFDIDGGAEIWNTKEALGIFRQKIAKTAEGAPLKKFPLPTKKPALPKPTGKKPKITIEEEKWIAKEMAERKSLKQQIKDLEKEFEKTDAWAEKDNLRKEITDLKNLLALTRIKKKLAKPQVTLDSLGFQQIYEGFTQRVKKTKPDMPRVDLTVFDKGAIIKQRKSKARKLEFPPVYEAELKVVKAASEKDMPRGALFKHGFQNPPRIFDQYFGEDFKSMTYWQIAEAKHRADVGYKSFKNRVNKLKGSVPLKSRKRIKIYEIAQQEGGLKRLENQGIKEIPKLTAKERAVYKEGEGIYELLYHALNKARKLAGKEPFPKVKNYGPFIHDLGLLEQMGFSPGLERFDIINQYIQMRATPFRFAKPRADFFAKKLELDYFSTMDQYGHSAINHIQMSPVISKLHEFTLTFGKKGEAWRMNEAVPRKAQWYRSWLDHVAGKPSMLDQTVGPFVTRSLNKLNQNATFAILGGNLRTVLIQPSALMHTYVELGPKYTLKGILSLIDPKQRNMAFEKSTHLLSREYDVAARDAYAAIKKGTFREWAGKKAMKGVQLTDMEAALATWQGAYLKGVKELNYTERKAARYADDVTIRTQASAARGDISPIQRSKIGRVATLFQTFVINEWNFMVNDVIGYKTPSIKGYERFKRIRRFVIGCTLVNMFYEDILGLSSPYPSPIGAFRKAIEEGKELPSLALDVFKELIEKVPIISGARYGAVGPAWLSKTVKSMYTGKRIAETVGTLTGIPATSQIGKMIRAEKRGETPLGVLLGRYTPEQVLRERLRRKHATID